MAAESYIQTAITHVQTAASDLQQQITGLQHQASNDKSHLQQEISSKERERTAEQAIIGGLEEDVRRSALMARLSQLNREIDDKKNALGHKDSEIAPMVLRKTELLKRLNKVEVELNNILGQPDLH